MSAFRDDALPSKQHTGQPSELHVYTVHWVNKSSVHDVTRDPAARHLLYARQVHWALAQ